MQTEPGVPLDAEIWQVDQAIECLGITDDTRAQLLRAMPGAYDFEPPGEDDSPPEPDANPERKVARVWWQLDEEARKDLIAAWEELLLPKGKKNGNVS